MKTNIILRGWVAGMPGTSFCQAGDYHHTGLGDI